MSLYGNFTLKEWSDFHCITKDIGDPFCKTLKDNNKPMAAQNATQNLDGRLDKFLESFMQNGWFSVEFGFFAPNIEWDSHCKEHVAVNVGRHYSLTIKDGLVLNREEIPNVLSILDAAGVTNALPVFSGKELDLYTLDDDDNWVSSEETKDENFFYATYYSLE